MRQSGKPSRQPIQAARRLLAAGPAVFARDAAHAMRSDVERLSIASTMLVAALLLVAFPLALGDRRHRGPGRCSASPRPRWWCSSSSASCTASRSASA